MYKFHIGIICGNLLDNLGSRLGFGMPKCLVEVKGHRIFEYQLEALDWADEIRMVVGYHADEVVKQVSAYNPIPTGVHTKTIVLFHLEHPRKSDCRRAFLPPQ